MKSSANMRRQLQKQKKDAELAEIEILDAKLEEQAPARGVREICREFSAVASV